VAHALVESGRRVVNLDLRGHGGSEWPEDGRYDLESHIEDLRAVLAQMASRPVVVAATLGGWIATAALSTDAANLAAGLALVDMPARSDADTARQIASRLADNALAQQWDERTIANFPLDDVAERLLAAAP
jgi:pimeloyl-ACP methyl ester carboxylesterase